MTEFSPNPEADSPADLNDRDIELIHLQCQIQGATSPEQILGFADAYKAAKKFAYEKREGFQEDDVYELLDSIATSSEPENAQGFRRVPVVFENGNQAVSPQLIFKKMEHWVQEFMAETEQNADELYREFEEIHPFSDGNGRVGHLLWAIAKTRETGKWPEELPPNLFNEDRPQ